MTQLRVGLQAVQHIKKDVSVGGWDLAHHIVPPEGVQIPPPTKSEECTPTHPHTHHYHNQHQPLQTTLTHSGSWWWWVGGVGILALMPAMTPDFQNMQAVKTEGSRLASHTTSLRMSTHLLRERFTWGYSSSKIIQQSLVHF